MKFKKSLICALLGICVCAGLTACQTPSPAAECEKNGHKFERLFGESSATCTESGFQMAECSVCYEMGKVEVPAYGHTESVEQGYEATCTTNGLTDKVVCEVCSEVLTPSTVIPKGHTIGEVKYIRLPRPGINYKGYVEFYCGRQCENYFGQKNIYTNAEHTNGQFPLPSLTDSSYTVEVDGEDTNYTVEVLGKTVEFTVSNFDFTYFGSEEASLYAYYGTTANLVLPQTYENKPVTVIGENAFKNNTTLETIVLPNTIKSIYPSAFEGCTALKSIVLPEGCEIIDDKAFKGCTSLTSVTIPSTIVYIYQEAFKDCISLESISLPENLNMIGQYAFDGCQTIESVNVPVNTFIQAFAFKNCTSLETFVLSRNTEGSILMGCNNLKTLTVQRNQANIRSLFTSSQSDVVPASLKEITIVGDVNDDQYIYGYAGLENIEKVTILNCEGLAYDAFKNCTSLTTVILPDNLKKIDVTSFSGCTSLATTNSNNGKYLGNEKNPYLALIGYVEPASDCEFTVNENTEIMSIELTFWCDFTAYNIHNGIKNITTQYSTTITPKINYGGTASDWFSIDASGFDYSQANITFDDGTTKQDITHLVIEEGVTSLLKYQLVGFDLTAITLPKSINFIEAATLSSLENLKTIYYNGEYKDWNTSFANVHTQMFKNIEHVYFFDGTEYYEPTYAKYNGSMDNIKCFNKLEKLVIAKNVNLGTNATLFDDLIGKVDIYYLGDADYWALYGDKKTKLEAKFNVYCYSETEQTLNEYFSNPVKLWHYDENDEPKAWVEVGKTVSGKTYNYTTTTVQITDAYWYMIQQLKNNGMLGQMGLTQEEINMINSSNTKAEYEEKLSNFSKLAGSNMTISFAGGVMTVKKDGTVNMNYYEVNGKIYVRVLGSYSVYATIDGNTLIEETVDEYTSIKHVWTLA